MAEDDPPYLVEAVTKIFEPFVNVDSVGSRRILPRSIAFAEPIEIDPRTDIGVPDQLVAHYHADRFIRVDEVALLKAILTDGVRFRAPLSTATWLAEWMEEEEIDPEPLIAAPEREGWDPLAELQSGTPLALSSGLRDRILPRAVALAVETVGRERADIRHILFALLDEPEAYAALQGAVAGGRLARLRAHLVKKILAEPESGENAEAWQRQVRPAEAVRTHSDAPAIVDSLGRLTFAEVLGERIKDVGANLRTSGRDTDSAFILHMDGPWGSGKSSILNFLRADLEAAKPGWLVIEFNAWRNQHRKPAWLPLILEVRSAAFWHAGLRTPLVWLTWFWWRLRMDWMPYLYAVVLLASAGFLAWWAGLGGTQSDPLHDLGEASKAIGAIIATVLSVLALARGFAMGSQRDADTYLATKSEPFRRVVRYFERLIWAVHRPVAVFVDDLDRCDGPYVIELLEGIQTSLRAAPIVYVVAGDRKWISSSFEKRYEDFSQEQGTPGRPLGYLFLDKVFQLSTSMPRLTARRQADYWRQLLERSVSGSTETLQEQRLRLEAKAAAGIEGKTRQEDIQEEIDKTREGTVERETLLAAAAKATTSAEAVRAVEHRLQPFATLLEANPRAMKRLVNAYGLNQARAYLEDRKVPVEALARWTIIELRWPLLADYITRSWPDIDLVSPGPAVEAPYAEMLKSHAVANVIGAEGVEGRLTKENLGPILD
jgi:hypothetical protein